MLLRKILFIALLAGTVANTTNGQDVTGLWSGTVTFTQRGSGSVGTFETQYTLTFRDNVGRGTMFSKSSMVIEENKFCDRECKGAGEARIHRIAFDDEELTYSIEATASKPHCIFTGSYCDIPEQDGEPFTIIGSGSLTNAGTTINKNVLVGSQTSSSEVPELMTETTTVTWNLVRTLDIFLIVTPQDYDNWLPKPGRDEKTKGSVMKIDLKLQKRNGQPPDIKAKWFELKLSNTSHEPGITINQPLIPEKPALPDIRFVLPANLRVLNQHFDESFQSVQIDCYSCLTETATVAAYDGGGYTTLTAVAVLEDNTRISGTLLVPGGAQEILIPKRAMGSNIATKWLNENGNPGDSDDLDSSKDNTNKGDGLSAYEEYRGVISWKKFVRLNPKKKEVGIKVDKGEHPLFSTGIKWFENGSGLKVHLFDLDEIANDRSLNPNYHTAHIYDQFVLYLYKGFADSALGMVVTPSEGPEIPANTEAVIIDPAVITREFNFISAAERPARLPFSIQDMTANTVAHELGHGVNTWHHGELPNEPNAVAERAGPVYRIFRRNGSEELRRPFELISVGKTRNQESGDLSCVMAYYPFNKWAYTVGADGAKIYNEVPLIPVGTQMCKSDQGTHFNHSTIYFGDAAKGNCLKQLKLIP